MQCPLFTFADSDFSPEESGILWRFAHNVHQLTVDVSYMQAAELPPQIHYIPFATNFHYVPKLPGRQVRLGASYPESSLQEPGPVGAERISLPPTRSAWAPAKLAAHERPVLACYVGKNSRKPEHLRDKMLEGWQLKDAVCALLNTLCVLLITLSQVQPPCVCC